MHVIRRRGWEIPERLATSEHLFLNRRGFLAASGAAALSLAPKLALAQRISDLPDSTSDLYPVDRNEKYTVDRPITDEKINTSYNNFYEFGSTKTVAKAAQALKPRPWTVKIDGMVETPQEIGIDELIPQDAARGAPLSPSLRRGVVDGHSVERFCVRQAGGIGQTFIVGKIRADGDVPRSFGGARPEAELVSLAVRRGPHHR